MHQFWLRYFAATEKTSWLACLSAPQRLSGLPERAAAPALKNARGTDAVGGDRLKPIADIMCD
ncbi:hypothetical protein LTSEJOH_0228 [Salmonella enterica subsp. enterica serovar Johannesburg str. S5-703]|nr:hypothetical protein LTSEJOH_0228 [Salmonella enterica subsp. enterica serovar Johannesburg str. S5-703]